MARWNGMVCFVHDLDFDAGNHKARGTFNMRDLVGLRRRPDLARLHYPPDAHPFFNRPLSTSSRCASK